MTDRRLLFSILIFLVFSVGAVSAQEILGTACEPYGTVTIRGEPASDNLIVIAYVGDIELARGQRALGDMDASFHQRSSLGLRSDVMPFQGDSQIGVASGRGILPVRALARRQWHPQENATLNANAP